MSDHAARHRPGTADWVCKCGFTHPYTTALAMIDEFHDHVRDEREKP